MFVLSRTSNVIVLNCVTPFLLCVPPPNHPHHHHHHHHDSACCLLSCPSLSFLFTIPSRKQPGLTFPPAACPPAPLPCAGPCPSHCHPKQPTPGVFRSFCSSSNSSSSSRCRRCRGCFSSNRATRETAKLQQPTSRQRYRKISTFKPDQQNVALGGCCGFTLMATFPNPQVQELVCEASQQLRSLQRSQVKEQQIQEQEQIKQEPGHCPPSPRLSPSIPCNTSPSPLPTFPPPLPTRVPYPPTSYPLPS